MAMRLGASARTQQKQTLQTKIDPKIILTSQIVQLNQMELEQAIAAEVAENPALERMEEAEEPISREDIMRSLAPEEMLPSGGSYEAQRSLPQDDSSGDWMDWAAGNDSLWDSLLVQLRARLDPEFCTLAAYLVGSVNERGYLTISVEEAALDCGVSLEEAEAAVAALRQCEPPGVGATDLRDCLILQLRDAETPAERFARHILIKDWDELVARNARAIMRRYQLGEEEVQEAFDIILRLNPFPGEEFGRQARIHSREASVRVQADIKVSLSETGWQIDVPGPGNLSLQISRSYSGRLEQVKNSHRASTEEKKHLTEYVDRAQRFLDAISQRRKQLLQIGQYLVERQGGFLQTGDYKFLESLTRSQMAKDLGIHESTISRATNGKFLQIATGEVVSFDVLFKPALRVQQMIQEILAHENPDNPLSDERIADMLAAKGVSIARRTVNKYRDRHKLLSSRHRRMA